MFFLEKWANLNDSRIYNELHCVETWRTWIAHSLNQQIFSMKMKTKCGIPKKIIARKTWTRIGSTDHWINRSLAWKWKQNVVSPKKSSRGRHEQELPIHWTQKIFAKLKFSMKMITKNLSQKLRSKNSRKFWFKYIYKNIYWYPPENWSSGN